MFDKQQGQRQYLQEGFGFYLFWRTCLCLCSSLPVQPDWSRRIHRGPPTVQRRLLLHCRLQLHHHGLHGLRSGSSGRILTSDCLKIRRWFTLILLVVHYNVMWLTVNVGIGLYPPLPPDQFTDKSESLRFMVQYTVQSKKASTFWWNLLKTIFKELLA